MYQQLKVMIDGYNLGLERGTGVATYGRNLSRILKLQGCSIDILYGGKSVRSKNSLLREVSFFDATKRKQLWQLESAKILWGAMTASLGCQVDSIPLSGKVVFDSLINRMPEFDQLLNSTDLYRRSLRSFRWFNRFAKIELNGVDIAHWTYPLPILANGCANVYTLHDLVPLRLPHTTLDNKNTYFRLCKKIVDTADHIVTVSETSRNDIISLLDGDPAKITNTYQSVSFPKHLINKSEQVIRDELLGIFNLKYKEYFLFYGAIEPKKNVGRMIEAYLASAVKTPLVIIGAPGWSSDEELRLLKILNTLPNSVFSRQIIQLEYLPLPMLVSMIRGAKATLFPSLYEGFGLPVLESMLLGTAVITSNTSSLPEVAGDAAILIDPYDPSQIADAIRALDTNSALRNELEAKGRTRACMFDENAYSQRINAVYSTLRSANGR